jgi:hypothetical protein
LAHAVMRELDSAGAPYFALTLRTPPGNLYLVCGRLLEPAGPLCETYV